MASLPFPHALIMPGVGGWVIKFGTANTKNYSRGYTLQHCCLADGARVCAPAALASLPFTHAQKHAWNIVNFEHFALLINKKKRGGWVGNHILGRQCENCSRGYTLQHRCVADCARVCGPAALASLPFPHKMLGVGGRVIIFWAATQKTIAGAIPCSIVVLLIVQGCVVLQPWPPCPSPMP